MTYPGGGTQIIIGQQPGQVGTTAPAPAAASAVPEVAAPAAPAPAAQPVPAAQPAQQAELFPNLLPQIAAPLQPVQMGQLQQLESQVAPVATQLQPQQQPPQPQVAVTPPPDYNQLVERMNVQDNLLRRQQIQAVLIQNGVDAVGATALANTIPVDGVRLNNDGTFTGVVESIQRYRQANNLVFERLALPAQQAQQMQQIVQQQQQAAAVAAPVAVQQQPAQQQTPATPQLGIFPAGTAPVANPPANPNTRVHARDMPQDQYDALKRRLTGGATHNSRRAARRRA